jgi:hypothetical protein
MTELFFYCIIVKLLIMHSQFVFLPYHVKPSFTQVQTGKNDRFYILIFIFWDSKNEDKRFQMHSSKHSPDIIFILHKHVNSNQIVGNTWIQRAKL